MKGNHKGSWQAPEAAEFEATVLPFRGDLSRAALRLTQSLHSAEDLVQETFIHAFQGFGRFQKGTNLRAWLMRILLNLFISQYRHQKRSVPTVSLEGLLEELERAEDASDLLIDLQESPEEKVLSQVMDYEVQKALEKLPEPFREAVILCDLDGHSYAEAAAMLKVPVGTIRSRLFRGREMLRRLLADYARKRRLVPRLR